MKHNIYIISSYNAEGEVIYKVGYAANIPTRFLMYSSHNPSAKLVATYYREEGIEYERWLHSQVQAVFKQEWYDKVGLERALSIIENNQLIDRTVKKIGKTSANKTTKDLFIEYINTQSTTIAEEYPFIKEAYDVLGEDKIKALEYRKKDIEAALIVANKKAADAQKIVSLLKLRVGQFITSKAAKEAIQEAYNQLGIAATAKASDLSKWYTVKDSVVSQFGTKQRGYTIITQNVKSV